MITKDQPMIFGNSVTVAVSSVEDGNMRFGRGDDNATLQNREAWFRALKLDTAKATLVQVTYDTNNFTRYKMVDSNLAGLGISKPVSDCIADALVTNTVGQTLFLPLADCAGVVLYDSRTHTLMVSHIGRHSVEHVGGRRSVEYMARENGSDPRDIKVWISPAVGKDTYPLRTFEGKGLQDVIVSQLMEAGVVDAHIEVCDVDTAASRDYFSHSQFKAGNRSFDGRHAIVASLK